MVPLDFVSEWIQGVNTEVLFSYTIPDSASVGNSPLRAAHNTCRVWTRKQLNTRMQKSLILFVFYCNL